MIEKGYTCGGGTPYRADYCYEICGDGYYLGTYDCDWPTRTGGAGCDSTCKIMLGYSCVSTIPVDSDCKEICGDGLDFFEYQCDDGNLVALDGCDANCNIEPGWKCEFGTNDWRD